LNNIEEYGNAGLVAKKKPILTNLDGLLDVLLCT
jgi:hypothetical protein